MKLSKRANVIYSPPTLAGGAYERLVQIFEKAIAIIKEKGFQYFIQNYDYVPLSEPLVVDFKDFPKQYDKFKNYSPYKFDVLLNINSKNTDCVFSSKQDAIILNFPDFSKNPMFVEPDVAQRLAYLYYGKLRHEITHAIQHAMSGAWLFSIQTKNTIPKQFSQSDYVGLPKNFSPQEYSNYITQPFEFEPWIISAKHKFLYKHSHKISMDDIKNFIKDDYFFQELLNKDIKLYNLAVKKFYKLIFDGLSPEQKQNLMKKSKLSLRHFSK